MAQGTIKKLVTDRGFGFISGDRGDVFFHFSSMDEGLSQTPFLEAFYDVAVPTSASPTQPPSVFREQLADNPPTVCMVAATRIDSP